MKVTTDYSHAQQIAGRAEPLFYSHLDGSLFGATVQGDRAEYVIGRRFRGLFDDTDGSYVAVTARPGSAQVDRDSYGAIPLFYSTDRPIVSTDIRLIVGLERPSFDLDALAEYLSAAYLTGGKTIYQNVRCLMPNETLAVRDGVLTASKKAIFPPQAGLSEREAGRLLEAAIDNSVADLLARYPSTILLNLSGGTDSTLLLAKIRERDRQRHVVTTTYFHEDWRNDLNDWEYAAKAAQTFGSQHHLCRINNETFCRAHGDLTRKAKSVFHTYAAAFYLQNEVVASLGPNVPIVNGSGPDESIIGTEKIPIGELRSLARLERGEWVDTLIGTIDYLKMPEAAVSAILRGKGGDFVAGRRAVAADLLDAPDFVEFQRRYHAVTVLQDHIQELSTVARVLGHPIVFPYLTNDIFKIIFSTPFDVLNAGDVYKSIVKKLLEKHMPRDFVHRRKIGFQSPSRPYFKSESGLGAELSRLFAKKDGAVLDLPLVEREIRQRLDQELDLHRRYDFLEWTAYNILRLEEMRGRDG